MYHLDGMLYREICQVTGLPMGTVMNRLFRARHKLKDALEALDAAQARDRRAAWAGRVSA
jgi:DNA-directed RNA polymerase specialized sigma24 family protein